MVRAMLLLGALAGVLVPAAAAGQQAPAPTYAKDIAPIVFAKCAACHRPGEVAPMSFLSYDETRPWARAIQRKTQTREMPPWHADPAHGVFSNDRTLTDRELETIVRWVAAGAPKGNDADMPPVPVFPPGWQGGTPDHVFEMPPWPVPAEGEVPNEYVWIHNPFDRDLLVNQLEVRPGNRAVVHHIRVDAVQLPEGCSVVGGRLVAKDGAGCREPGGAVDTINDRGDRYYLIAYVPGRGLDRHPPGTAKRIPAGAWIRFNVHYQPNGVAGTDQSRLGVWFANDAVTHEVFTRTAGQSLPTDLDVTRLIAEGREVVRDPAAGRGGNNGGGRLPTIPPHADNFEVIGITPITEPITLYSLSPHMHLRGKDMKWILTWPDGREETILDVPKYDFNWQLQYQLAVPLKIPAGSRIAAIAHFDNSIRNRYNPSPDKPAYWAEQSWDEMFSPFIEYSVDSLRLRRAGSRER